VTWAFADGVWFVDLPPRIIIHIIRPIPTGQANTASPENSCDIEALHREVGAFVDMSGRGGAHRIHLAY